MPVTLPFEYVPRAHEVAGLVKAVPRLVRRVVEMLERRDRDLEDYLANVEGGGPAILAVDTAVHNSGLSTTSTVFVDLPGAEVTFTAPDSGAVAVRQSGLAYMNSNAGPRHYWNLRDASGDIPNTAGIVSSWNNFEVPTACLLNVVTGLTPGQSYTWKWGWCQSGGTATIDNTMTMVVFAL